MSDTCDTGTNEISPRAGPPRRVLHTLAAPFKIVPPFLLVTGAAALAYTQAPKLEPSLRSIFASPPIAAPQPPAPVIDRTPVASIPTPAPAPAPAPVQAAPQVAAPAAPPAPVVRVVKHVAKKPVVHVRRVIAVQEDDPPPPPVRRYYPAPVYQRPAYVPVPLPIPIPVFGGHRRVFGGLGGFFGR